MVPEQLRLQQPINELEHLAASHSGSGVTFTHAALQLLTARWNQLNRRERRGPMIERLYFLVGASQLAGVVDRVRTSLVEVVSDLTADISFDQLPDKRMVDTSVQIHMYGSGDQNNIIVHGANRGVIGAGHQSHQVQNAPSLPTEVAERFGRLYEALDEIDDPDTRATIENAIDAYEESLTAPDSDPEQVRERGRLLSRLTESLGVTMLATGVFELVKAVSAAGLG